MIRSKFLGQRGWIAVLAALAVAGVAFRWHWLVALGIAPIVVSLAPCLIMCALGLRASRLLDKPGCDKSLKSADAVDTVSNSSAGVSRIDDALSLRLKL